MNMAKKIAVLLLFLLAFEAKASIFTGTLECVGIDDNGNTVHAIYDSASNTLNVDGNVQKIESDTTGHNGVATVDYISDKGVESYNSLTLKDGKYTLYQYNSVTDDLISKVSVLCHQK